jgi:hypothetical protein
MRRGRRPWSCARPPAFAIAAKSVGRDRALLGTAATRSPMPPGPGP